MRENKTPGRSLKNYRVYLQKIELYTKALDIKIIREEVPGDAAWVPSKRLIQIDSELEESSEIACLLHEIGHATDDVITKNYKSINRAYKRCYTHKISNNQLKLILDCENRAWDIGITIAKQLRIPLGKWYSRERADGLKAYESN